MLPRMPNVGLPILFPVVGNLDGGEPRIRRTFFAGRETAKDGSCSIPFHGGGESGEEADSVSGQAGGGQRPDFFFAFSATMLASISFFTCKANRFAA